ncbi:MAG: hypothetical protein NTZ81_05780 [Actinobacteria bacterium]|nr:hypothetical protein [Actinomycetota bacterium]
MTRTSKLTARLLVLGALLVAAPSAAAHATIELKGEQPIAGKRGTLTVTIPHGCGIGQGGVGLATDRLVVRLGSGWPSAKAIAIDGWTSTVARASAGNWTITWAIAVRWPRAAGIYKTPSFQHCGANIMKWADPYASAASADQDYPPIYPVPRIQILPAS